MVGDFGSKQDLPEHDSINYIHSMQKRAATTAQSSRPSSHATTPAQARPDSSRPISRLETPQVTAEDEEADPVQQQMLARERAAEKVAAQERETAAAAAGGGDADASPLQDTGVVSVQGGAATEATSAGRGARRGAQRAGKTPASSASSSAGGMAAGSGLAAGADAAKKGPGKKEEGASWEVLDNLRMVSDGTRLVTHKRQFIVFNETLNHTVLRHWLEYVDGNETLIYHFPRSLFELLPLEEPQWHFKTCAVVGNSGVVLLRENGEDIDAHDAVLRINMAPIRGFEHYVGKKTTFNIVNSHNVRELLQGLRHWTSTPESESRLVMFETASHFARYHLCQPLLKKFPQANPILLNPIFSNRAHRVWVQLKYLLEQQENNQYNRKPMSGFFAVFFALNVCDKVDLYGFDAYTSKKRSYRYHYFDNVQGFTDVHSFDLALEVFKLFSQRGFVQIVT
eukprot:CAMPEP_0114234268 /NCGR_PEP_ID=MMETSP0058-20121206/5622_1 /TAXON_ID=36894 /ORGANISM="Pyramimonas parkeae, CCMP726" /LENGTH=453 /DNA_ID=CAMNT_0001345943 /DNA_START=415 /DNA_END=1776 /DNA_ORIENTATION=-